MFESGACLPEGIWYFHVIQPFTDEKGLAVYFRSDLAQMLNVMVLHGQDQVRLVEQITVDLTGTVGAMFQAMFNQQFMGQFVHGTANQGANAGRADGQPLALGLVQ